MDGPLLSLALVLLFVLIGGFFAASELALVSLRDGQVRRMADADRRGARVARLRADENRFLSAVQIGVTLAGFFSAAYGGSTLAEPLGAVLTGWGVPAAVAGTTAFIAVTVAISYLSLVLGELVPKRLALQRPEGVALAVAPALDRIAAAGRPLIWLLGKSTNGVVRLLGLDPKASDEGVSEEELQDMVRTHRSLGPVERRVLGDVFGAADRTVGASMVPRTEVEFLPAAMSLREATSDVLDRSHSRYPVIGATVDDVVGVVHIRDLFTVLLRDPDAADRELREFARPLPFLPAGKPVLDALSEMRAGRAQLAVVVDEYGGTDGILALEDILEELVGEIEDEYDPAPVDGETDLDGLLHRDELTDRTGIRLPSGPYETLAGFVQTRLGRVPREGDTVETGAHRFTVTQMDGLRVARVRVHSSRGNG
ncbi:hemolysin family protein [Pseudonocardia nigra]|uniref:hemolysin family protein n=1 Tax=Pseudonocardia nigra TaxID=1921578 RepID=UPI001C5FDBAA|nr:hemolysin family protein [Pseudonocardia nigra]